MVLVTAESRGVASCDGVSDPLLFGFGVAGCETERLRFCLGCSGVGGWGAGGRGVAGGGDGVGSTIGALGGFGGVVLKASK